MIRKILFAVVAVAALMFSTAAPATAKPNRDVAYSWTVTLPDPDGESKPAYLTAGVRYERDGTVQTYCNYAFRRPNSFVADLNNLYYYSVDHVVADTSRDGLFQHCMDAWLRGDAVKAVPPA